MKRASKLLLSCLLILGVYLLCYFSDAIPIFDYRIFDLLSKNRGDSIIQTAKSTVVVEIDEASLQQYGQWPWPRLLLAKGVENILNQRPAAVGFDIFFPEADRTSPEQLVKFYRQTVGRDIDLGGIPEALRDYDQVFAQVLSRGPTVLPLFAQAEARGEDLSADLSDFQLLPQGLTPARIETLIFNTALLQQAASGFGYINAEVDSDGVFRRLPLIMEYRGMAVPTLSLAMLRQIDPTLTIHPPANRWSPASFSFADKTVYFNRQGEVLNLLSPRESFQHISLKDVMAGHFPPGFFSGKLVLVGATAAGLYDHYMTPSGDLLPGVYVHAALLENIMHGQVLYQPDGSKDVALLLSFIFSLIIVWMVLLRHYLVSWSVYLGATFAALTIGWVQLQQGYYLSIGYFLTPFSFLFFAVSLFFAVLHFFERKRFLEDLGEAHSATIDSMTMVAESRDVETGAHIIRTKEYVRLLAEYLRMQTVYKRNLSSHVLDLLYRAAPLHDIGKVGIPDIILQKPGRLDSQEMETMKTHVEIGRSIIDNAINSYNKTNEFLTIASNIAYSHHEKWDGTGYPLGLKGEEIPLEGRMMALADVYDALISRRCYKDPLPIAEAEKIIINDSGRHFDPLVVAAFVSQKERFQEIALRYVEGDDIDSVSSEQRYRFVKPVALEEGPA